MMANRPRSASPKGSQRVRFVFAALLFTLGTASAQDTRVQQLERSLRERDKVISELLERVETLERRVGVPPRAGARNAEEREPVIPPSATAGSAEGSGQAPGTVVVEEGAAERALERSLTREGALLLPSGVVEIEPALRYVRREDAAPRFLTAGGALFASETRRQTDSLAAVLALRVGLPWDSQLEIGVPYRWHDVASVTRINFAPADSGSASASALGDLRLGLAKTLLRESLWRPDVVARIVWDSDTGDRQKNGVALGGGFHELQGSLTAIKRQDPVAFIGGLAYEHSFENSGIRPGPTISANVGGFVALSPETSLRLQLAAARQQETEFLSRAIPGSDRTVGTFVVGGSTLLGRGTLFNLSAGIGLTEDADDFSLTLSLPIRFRGM